MRIGGFQKLSLVDFPGLIASTVFTQGCNFRCGYCHNPELVLPQNFGEPLLPSVVMEYLSERRGQIEGVVISGGEPTIQKGLADFIVQIKSLGYAVKLDTNGSHPEVISSLINSKLLDYIAMDIKTSLARYPKVTGVDCDIMKLRESIGIIINSGIPYQFRTTLVKESCSEGDLEEIQLLVQKADHYVLQPFVHSPKIIDPGLDGKNQYTPEHVELLKSRYDRCQLKEIL